MNTIHSAMQKNEFALLQHKKVLQRLDPDENRARERYGDIERRLVKFFECNACFPAEHFAKKTLRTADRQLRDQEVDDVLEYIFAVGSEIAKEKHGFDRLLRHLDGDRARAGYKYEKLRLELVRYFRRHDCCPAEDLVDRTFDRVAQKLGEEPVGNLPAFVMGFAKNIMREAGRIPRTIDIQEWEPGFDTMRAEQAATEREKEELQLRCLDECIHELSSPDREIFLEYYISAGNCPGEEQAAYRKRLAQHFQLALNALQVRVHRLMRKIEQCVRQRAEKGLANGTGDSLVDG
jgi:DNA-directed RNA polymerase specialized sigma24 family protein